MHEVLSAEQASRDESVIRQRLREARFPEIKTLDTFDFAAAEGVTISEDRFTRLKEYMDGIPPSTRSSLLIDLEMGKRIEVEALQGAAVRRGAKHGLSMPIISTLYAVLRPWAAGPAKRT